MRDRIKGVETRKEVMNTLVLFRSSGMWYAPSISAYLFPQSCVEHAQFLGSKSSSWSFCFIQLKNPLLFGALSLFPAVLSSMLLMQQSAKNPFGGPQFLGLLKLSLEVVNIFLWVFILVQKTLNVQVFCVKRNVPLIFGHFPSGGGPKLLPGFTLCGCFLQL